MEQRFLGMEEPLAVRCKWRDATDATKRLARLCCHGVGAQVNQHQRLVHALSRTFSSGCSSAIKGIAKRAFNVGRDLPPQGHKPSREAASETLRCQGTATKRYSSAARMQHHKQAGVHMQAGSAD